ncbi:agmatine/peptidylarginine deiminase [Myxococcota bacterium]
MPAEWDPHAATWLGWPQARDWRGKASAIVWVFAEMARHLAPHERVRLLVRDRAERERAQSVLERAHVPLQQIDWFPIPTDRSWTRDYLPTFVTRAPVQTESRGALPRLAAVKWRFNGWGRYSTHRRDEAAGWRVAHWRNVPVFPAQVPAGSGRQPVVLEGGALDVDGQGTVIVCEECLLRGRFARCPQLGRAGVERVLADYLGVERVLWMEAGIAGDDTSGHVDDFVRFVAPGRVVLCQEPQADDPNHRPLQAARDRLEGACDAAGRRLEIIPLPMPRPLCFAGRRLPASYANFYLANSVLLVPTFNDPMDRVALGIMAELFPDREVVGIHAVDLVLGLGTIHCSTQQEPLGQPRAHFRG